MPVANRADHFFLPGLRGTSKTLWCANQFPNALRVDLLDPATLRQLMAQPERLRELVDANIRKKHIVIDEIQKLPGRDDGFFAMSSRYAYQRLGSYKAADNRQAHRRPIRHLLGAGQYRR
jgi:hypothetical protein